MNIYFNPTTEKNSLGNSSISNQYIFPQGKRIRFNSGKPKFHFL